MKVKTWCAVGDVVKHRGKTWVISNRFGGYTYLVWLGREKEPLKNAHLEPVTSVRSKSNRFVKVERKLNDT